MDFWLAHELLDDLRQTRDHAPQGNIDLQSSPHSFTPDISSAKHSRRFASKMWFASASQYSYGGDYPQQSALRDFQVGPDFAPARMGCGDDKCYSASGRGSAGTGPF